MTFIDQYIVSRTKSRIRLRIPQLRNNETAVKIFEEVRNVAGVETADINETTGSLLIRFVPELFDEQQLEKILQHNLEGLPVSSRGGPEKILRSKELRKVENQSMMLFGGATLASIFLKNWKLHTYAGIAYTAFTLLHMYRYRKTLTR